MKPKYANERNTPAVRSKHELGGYILNPDPPSPAPHERNHAVFTAGYWFKGARAAQAKGNLGEALLCMENAYNHVEGALVALRREHGIPLIDETPN